MDTNFMHRILFLRRADCEYPLDTLSKTTKRPYGGLFRFPEVPIRTGVFIIPIPHAGHQQNPQRNRSTSSLLLRFGASGVNAS